MRAFARVLGVLGAFLFSVAGIWGLGVGSAAGTSLAEQEESVSAFSGTLTFVGTVTDLSPLPEPLPPIPLDLETRLYTVDVSPSTLVVRREYTQTVGVLEPRTYPAQYAVDRQTYRQVESRLAYDFAPANVVDRSGTFGPFLPPGAVADSYPIWNDTTGAAVDLVRTGEPVDEGGLSLVPMAATTDDARVSDQYLRSLRDALALPTSVPSTAPLQDLRAMFAPTGVDPVTVASIADAWLTDTDRELVAEILARPVTLKYLIDLDATLLVEPGTGMPSSFAFAQRIAVEPDTTELGRLHQLFAAPRYLGNPVMTLAAGLIDKVAAAPPRTDLLEMEVTETPTSVAATVTAIKLARQTAAAAGGAGHVVPTALASVGASAFLIGIGLGWREHRRGPAPESWRGIRARTWSAARRCGRGAVVTGRRLLGEHSGDGGSGGRPGYGDVERSDDVDQVVTVRPVSSGGFAKDKPVVPFPAVGSVFAPRPRTPGRSTPGEWSAVDVLASDDPRGGR